MNPYVEEPLKFKIQLYGTEKSTAINLRSGLPVNCLKKMIVVMTIWFPDGVSPSAIKLYRNGHELDSSLVLDEGCCLCVELDPNAVIPRQRGLFINQDSFSFLLPEVDHVCIADTSIVKALILGEIKALPLSDSISWISTRQTLKECKRDQRILPLNVYWPSCIVDGSEFITGLTPDIQALCFSMLYNAVLQGKTINGYCYPYYDDFCVTDRYQNTFSGFVTYFEALIVNKYLSRWMNRSVRVSLLTLDVDQGLISELCSKDPDARDIMKHYVEDGNISELKIFSLPSRQFPDLLM